ncbi:MAG: FKBP-type peptidyl-prolyl cis-trans isomerase [Actinomycetaceae bacterium]|nr:FKBP-type peptidyl-prolyl cis-trans isomerase [Actinomycetaceae bacterium]
MKKKTLSLLLAPVLAAGFLVGCSDTNDSGDAESTEPTQATTEAQPEEVPVERNYDGEIPEVGGEWGKSVELKPSGAVEPNVVVAKTLIEGDGKEVGPDDVVAAHYHGTLWNGEVFDSTFENAEEGKNSTPLLFSLNQVIQGWKYGLAGQNVGDRVELVIPSEYGYGESGASELIPGGATLVFVVDIVGAADLSDTSALSEAELTSEKPPAGMAVEGPLGAKPTISFDHDAKSPEEPSVIVLAEGKGDAVEPTDAVVYHITGADWGKGDEAQSSWDTEAAQYSSQAVGDTPGFKGMKVGSRVLVLQPNPQNPDNAMAFVVDIVDSISLAPVE